jgi:hypothetical protein
MKEMIFVYKGDGLITRGPHTGCINTNYPPYRSLVNVYQSECWINSYVVVGYEINSLGHTQSFQKKWFIEPASISELTEILNHEPQHA